MNKFFCRGCELELTGLKSRCLMQIPTNKWNGHCIKCCCLNKRRMRDCDDPTGLGWVRPYGWIGDKK